MASRIIITGKAGVVFDRLKAMAGEAVPPVREGGPFDGRWIDRDALERERQQEGEL